MSDTTGMPPAHKPQYLYTHPQNDERRPPSNASISITVCRPRHSIANQYGTNEQGFDPNLIEAALAHTGKNEVRNAYNRAQYIERCKRMMNWWSSYVEQAATGNMSLTGSRHLSVVNS